jgi:hypothetical protein
MSRRPVSIERNRMEDPSLRNAPTNLSAVRVSVSPPCVPRTFAWTDGAASLRNYLSQGQSERLCPSRRGMVTTAMNPWSAASRTQHVRGRTDVIFFVAGSGLLPHGSSIPQPWIQEGPGTCTPRRFDPVKASRSKPAGEATNPAGVPLPAPRPSGRRSSIVRPNTDVRPEWISRHHPARLDCPVGAGGRPPWTRSGPIPFRGDFGGQLDMSIVISPPRHEPAGSATSMHSRKPLAILRPDPNPGKAPISTRSGSVQHRAPVRASPDLSPRPLGGA